ncbi:MAG: S8 family serine peptidase [Gemmatales bacterium]
MPRSASPRRVPNTRLLLEHLEDRNLFDVAMGSLFSERLADPLAALAATHDNTGLPLGRNESGHTRNLQAGPHRLVGTQNGSVVTLTNSGEHGAGDLNASGMPDSPLKEPIRPSATSMTGSVQMSWLGENRRVVPGSWVVQLSSQNGSIAASSLDSTLAAHTPGLQVATQIGSNGWFRITAPAEYTADTVAAAVGQAAPILSIHPEFADYSVSTIPNDQYFQYQQSLHNTGADYYGLPDADIDAPEAWSHTGPDRGSTSVIVAVNDTGVDYTHPDLYLNIWINQSEIPAWVTAVDTDGDGIITFWDLNDSDNAGVATDLNGTGYIDAGDILFPEAEGGWADGIDEGTNGFTDDLIGWDFANGDNDPYDDNAHGTHVAGTIGAIGNNGVGVAGVVWKTQLMITAGLNWEGWGTDVDLAAAITYSVDNGARVTNASWGGEYSSLIDAAVVYAGAADHLVVAAAGNDFNDNDAFPDFSFPASLTYDNILSVGSTDAYDYPSYFTNYGAISVDLMAPGDSVISTVPKWWYGDYVFAYEWFGGTSMAAPHVTGSAALLWASNSSASLGDIRTAILNGVDYLPDLDPVTGYTPVASGGRLNLFGALQQLHPDGLFVLATTPSEGETVTGTTPSEYTVTFNSAVQLSVDPADLQASDFSVNGVPATGVTLSSDGLTATFTFTTEPITTEGLETMQIAPGSVRRIDTDVTLTGGYQSTFKYDSVQLAVIDVTPAPGSVIALGGPYTFRMYFNEAIDPDSFDPNSFGLWLYDQANGYGYVPDSAVPVLGNTAFDLTFYPVSNPSMSEGTLSLILNPGYISDIYGNPNLDYFQADYTTDITTRPYPVPLFSSQPLGSLMATGTNAYGMINSNLPSGADTDDFTISLDAGQTLNVLLFQSATSLRARVDVYNPANVLVGSSVASAAGKRTILQSAPVATGGVYTVRVSGAEGTTGTYGVFFSLNTTLEDESYQSGPANNSPTTAQSLDSSFLTLSTDLSKTSRGAVIGNLSGAVDVNPGTTVYLADFESGNNGFTIDNSLLQQSGFADGFWHRTDRRGSDPNHSSSHSFWYGNEDTSNYNSGSLPNCGVIVSPVIALPTMPGGLNLDFKYFLDTRGGYVDYTAPQITTNGGASWITLNSYPYQYSQTPDGWKAVDPIDLSAYMGQSVQLRFILQSVTPVTGTHEGWYLDDIRIYQNNPRDYYSVSAKAGERIGAAIAPFNGGTQPFIVELLAPNGTTVLGTSISSASNLSGALSGVTVAADGTYYLKVTGTPKVTYNLVVTKDVLFGLEPNNSASTAQQLAGAKGALGYLEPNNNGDATDSGWYNSTGFHDPINENYIVGQASSTLQYRDWFVFDVPVATGPITAARLELYNPSSTVNDGNGYISPDASETYALYDVTTPVSTLRAGGSGLTGIYDDLGTGVSYGSVTVTAASNGTFIVINLNAAGIAAVSAAQGGQLAMGGALTTLGGSATQHLYAYTRNGMTRRLVITPSSTAGPSDWYSIALAGDQTALQVETRTPADGPGEFRNLLNPRIELYNASGTTLIASGTPLADGRNEKILVTGLTPGATYQVRIFGEGGTVGEYYMSATPLRVPTITSKVDDGIPLTLTSDGLFIVLFPQLTGWTNVTGAGWKNDYTVHQYGVHQSPLNDATWLIRATSSNPELFVTWVPRSTNATNATYQVFRNNTLLTTVVVNQQLQPNDSLLFGNTYAESLGKFTGIPVNSFLTVKLLTQGANGDVVADGVFDPPTGEELPTIQLVPGEEMQAPILSHELQLIGGLLATTSSSWLVPGTVGQTISLESRKYGQVWRDRNELDKAFIQQYQTVNERVYGVPRSFVESLLADTRALPIADQLFPLKRFPLIDSFDFKNDL